jgi:hypothetical protein
VRAITIVDLLRNNQLPLSPGKGRIVSDKRAIHFLTMKIGNSNNMQPISKITRPWLVLKSNRALLRTPEIMGMVNFNLHSYKQPTGTTIINRQSFNQIMLTHQGLIKISLVCKYNNSKQWMKRVKRAKEGTTICMRSMEVTHTNALATAVPHRKPSTTMARSISRYLLAVLQRQMKVRELVICNRKAVSNQLGSARLVAILTRIETNIQQRMTSEWGRPVRLKATTCLTSRQPFRDTRGQFKSRRIIKLT